MVGPGGGGRRKGGVLGGVWGGVGISEGAEAHGTGSRQAGGTVSLELKMTERRHAHPAPRD